MKKILLILHSAFFMLLATHAQTQQEWRDSVATLSSLIERYPHNTELRLRKAAANIELGQWSYALEEYSRVLDLEPTNIAALYYRGFVNQHLGRYDFARKDYENALKIVPLDRLVLMGLTLTNLADSHFTEAFDGANRLAELYPDDASVYEIRSEVEEKLGMTDAALDDIRKAISLEEKRLKALGKASLSLDEDMVSYQLSAFSLYLALNKRNKAKVCLDYLVGFGISRAQLDDYYSKVLGK